MTYLPDVRNVSDEDCEQKANELIPDRHRESIRREISELVELEFDRLESDAAYFLTSVAARRAEEFLERVLKGDENAASALFGIRGQGRYQEMGYNKGEPWCHLIHGKLFETDAITLRRRIVEAHADLLRNERIADLESIVDGLTRESREKDVEIERLRDRIHF